MNRHSIFIIITVWFLITQLFPPYFTFVPMGGALTLTIFIGLTILLFPSLAISRSMLWLYVYVAILFVKHLFSNTYLEEINSVILIFLSMASGLLVLEYALKYGNFKYFRLVTYLSAILILIITMLSIPQIIINPNIIRGASTYLASVDNDFSVFYWVISYACIHTMIVLIPPIVYFIRKNFKNNKKLFWFWLVVLVVFLFIILESNATIPLLVTLIILAVSILFKFEKFTSRNVFKLAVVGVFALLLMSDTMMYGVLDFADDYITEGSNYDRIQEMKNYYKYGDTEGDLAVRQNLYEDSQKLFAESPLVGTYYPEKIGLHSFFWDQLALFGIIFIIPLFMILYTFMQKVYKNLTYTKVTFVFGACAYFMILYLKNQFGFFMLFGLLPVYCKYIDSYLSMKYNKNRYDS